MRYHKLKDIQAIWWKSHKKSNESYPTPKPTLAKVLVPSTKHHKAKLYSIDAQYLSDGKKVKLSNGDVYKVEAHHGQLNGESFHYRAIA